MTFHAPIIERLSRVSKSYNVYAAQVNDLAKEMKIEKRIAERMIYFLIRSLVQRVPLNISNRLVLELPSLLHEDFYDMRRITVTGYDLLSIKTEFCKRYKVKNDQFLKLLPKFWRGLKKAISHKTASLIFEFLPADIQMALTDDIEYDSDFFELDWDSYPIKEMNRELRFN